MWGRVAALVGTLVAFPSCAWTADPAVSARAAIVVDAGTGAVIWERHADAVLPPASTTKVLTAIVGIESGRLDRMLTASRNAADTPPSKIGLRAGERMALEDLLYAVLLNSANDASTVVAEGIGGSEAGFATRMNAKARAIGASSTHFVNAHGLTADGHVSTARDLAALFRYGLQLREFREILDTPRIKVPIDSRRVKTVTLHSHNRLLVGWEHRVIGKTGYTRPAGRCFVGSASDAGREVIIAMLGSSDLWGDARRLFAHAFGEPSDAPIVEARNRARESRGRTVIATEGDEDVADRFKRSGVHVASIDRRRAVAAKKKAPDASLAVRLGPYPSRKAAETARNRLAKSGYRGRVVGQAIMVGSFKSRKSADKVAKNLRVKGYRPTIVAAR